jgi:MYXO-CTERM domain-containing protein
VNHIKIAVLATLAAGFYARESRADLPVDVDLTLTSPFLKVQSQKDPRWSGFPVGIASAQFQKDALGEQVNMARCGCMLTSLSTATETVLEGSLPWLPSAQIEQTAEARFVLGTALSFSPKYLDDYLNYGPKPGTRDVGWGYFGSSGGHTCGVEIEPWALSGMGIPNPVTLRTGFVWSQQSWTAAVRARIDDNLLQGIPTAVVYTPEGKSGGHANLIIGWSVDRKKYLIWDPMWATGTLNDKSATPAGWGWPTGATEDERYAKYTAAIKSVYVLDPVTTPKTFWMYITDDPEPIKLRLTDPRGRRTGYDPATGVNVQEDGAAFYSELTSFVDPLLVFPEAPPFRYVAARNPEPGGYGLEVFGTGDGPFKLTIGNVDSDQSSDATTVAGQIVAGETKRFEIVRAPNGSVTVNAVAVFTPRARAGNDGTAFLGKGIGFDGRGSYQVNGEIASHTWDFGDGTSATGAQQTHVYGKAGVYTAKLTAKNADGLAGTDERTIVVVDPASLPQMETLRASVTAAAAQAIGESFDSRITPDGRYVTFASTASNLVAGDTNASPDVFVKDLSTGAVERVSVATGGAQAISGAGSLDQRNSAITPDGRFVFFLSDAPNLVAGDVDQTLELFVRDRTAATTTRVLASGTVAPASVVSVSDDARYVAFDTPYQLVPADTDGANDVYVLDRQTSAFERASVTNAGTPADGPSASPRISANGSLVAFTSIATNLDALGIGGLFVHDRGTGTNDRVSLNAAGGAVATNPANTCGGGVCLALGGMSADGRYLTFATTDNGVAPGDTNAGTFDWDIFVRDRTLATTKLASASSTGEGANSYVATASSISADGRYVAFVSASNNLAPSGTTNAQLYRRDLQTGETARVSVDGNGVEATPNVYDASGIGVTLGGAVVFSTKATNLVTGDTNGTQDVFVRGLVPTSGGGSTPIANLGGPYLGWASSAQVPAGIRLDGSASVDPKARAVTAHWDFGDGTPIVDGELVTTHAYTVAGVYVVKLTVSAGTDTSKSISTEVQVMPALAGDAVSTGACAPPEGALSVSGAAVSANAALVAAGWDASTGKISLNQVLVTMPWGEVMATPSLPGLTFRTDPTVPAGFANGGYVAKVAGAKDAAFTVPCGTRSHQQPRAVAGGPIYDAKAGEPVTLDGSGSNAEGNASLTYHWGFGDGAIGTGANPTHTYASEGSYLVTLIVDDGTERSADVIGTHSFAMVAVSPAAPVDGGGCGCSTSPSKLPRGVALVMAMLLVARRRRRQGR